MYSLSTVFYEADNYKEYSTDLPHVPIKLHQLMIILAAVAGLLSCFISFFLICGHLFHWTKPSEQKHFVRIIAFVPVYSVCSFFSVWFYDASGYLTPIGQYYEGFAITAMFLLYVEYVTPDEGTRAEFYRSLEHRGMTGRKMSNRGSLGWYRRMWILVFQITITRIATLIAAMVLYSSTCPLSKTRLHGSIAIEVIQSVSTSFAVTGVILYEQRMREYLHPNRSFFKLFSFKGIIGLEATQAIIFPVLAEHNVFKPTPPYHVSWMDFDRGIPQFLVMWEMLLVAIVFLWSFDFRPYLEEARKGSPVVAKPREAFLHSFNVLDIFRDLWPEPTKRFFWEFFVRLTPPRLIQAIYRFQSTEKDMTIHTEHGSTSFQGKSAALKSILGLEGTPLLSRARTLAGLPTDTLSNKPAGLGNWDNSCYQNSMLQGLSSLPSFQRYIADRVEESKDVELPTHAALNNLMQALVSSENNGKIFWTPSALKSMSSWQQQDAQEYFSKVMGELEAECSKSAKKQIVEPGLSKNTESTSAHVLARSPLEGLLAQRVGCLNCGYAEGLSMIPFNCLTVTLGTNRLEYDIQSCLDEYTALEQIQGVECAKCSLLKTRARVERLFVESEDGVHGDPAMFKTMAGARLAQIEKALQMEDFSENTLTKQCHIPSKNRMSTTKSKQAVICRPPRSLVIHVNRSMFDEYSGMQFKNPRAVRFPDSLDLSPWTLGSHTASSDHEAWRMDPTKSMLSSNEFDSAQRAPCYELRAVVTHYGRHENGHYIAYKKVCDPKNCTVNSQSSSRWFELSDADVTEVSEEMVFCQGGVFMLFYEAVVDDAEYHEASQTPDATLAEAPITPNPIESAAEVVGTQGYSHADMEIAQAQRRLPTPPPEIQSLATPSKIRSDEELADGNACAVTTKLPMLPSSGGIGCSSSGPKVLTPEPSEAESSGTEDQDYEKTSTWQSQTSSGFVMRTAGERQSPHPHGGQSADVCNLPASPSVVSV
ncbi:MAG: hypothetical protein Q9227_004518 [Pyrenula ochraceoflavens]